MSGADVTIAFTVENDAVEREEAYSALLERAVAAVLAQEGVNFPCEAEVLYTDEAGILALNTDFRDKPSVTDVLSFPMFNFLEGEEPEEEPDSGRVHLGDMALCIPRCRAQAEEYGHSFERELCYLAVHSALHLLGYDHEDEAERAEMRRREESVMQALGLTR